MMKSFATLAVFAAFIAHVSAQTLMVNTPFNLVECQPSQLTWVEDGQPPYLLSIVPGSQTSPILKSFPAQTGNSFTWNVDLAAGQSITLALKDNQGQQVFSGPATIQAGTSTSCQNTTVQETGAGSSSVAQSSGATTAASTGTTSGATTGSGSSTKSGSTSSKSSGTSTGTAPASSNTGNAAVRESAVGALGLAGLMGLVGAALF